MRRRVVSNGIIEVSKRTEAERQPTWILVLHRWVMLLILEGETPGGFMPNIDCRIPSSSATQVDMAMLLSLKNLIRL